MTKKEVSERNHSISYIRFVAMGMIISCHFFQYYGNELAFWFNVGVQIFFVISGFLYGLKEIRDPLDFICNQFRKILLPYYVYLIVMSVLYFVFFRTRFSIKTMIMSFFCVETFEGLGHLWFVGYILFCYLITPYLFWVCKKVNGYSILKMSAIYMAIIILFVIIGTYTNFYFQPHRICCYIIGYILSACLKQYGKVVLKVTGIFFISTGFLVTIIRVYIKYYYGLTRGTLKYKLFFGIEPYMHLLLGVSLFFLLYFGFNKVKAYSFISWSDKYSYSIYLVHQTFILSPFSTMNLMSVTMINWLITLILIVVCGIVLYSLTEWCLKKFLYKER